jgi:long-chain acyl-CoA synthetase
MGIPLPSNYVMLVKPGTHEEVAVGEDGELCLTGPTVMAGYIDNDEDNNTTLQLHDDGYIWLHSGDIACMDEDGVFFYKQRLKRMIISSGYNVYPSQIEDVIEKHPAVLNCSVVGIPHKYKMEVAKAYIVLKEGYSPSLELKQDIKELCKKNLAVYSVPKEYEFRKSLPKTLLGKIHYKKLEQESNEE